MRLSAEKPLRQFCRVLVLSCLHPLSFAVQLNDAAFFAISAFFVVKCVSLAELRPPQFVSIREIRVKVFAPLTPFTPVQDQIYVFRLYAWAPQSGLQMRAHADKSLVFFGCPDRRRRRLAYSAI